MKKETAIVLLVVCFVAGFVGGAFSGITWYVSQHRASANTVPSDASRQSLPQAGGVQAVSPDDIAQAEGLVAKEPNNLNALVTLGNLYFDSGQPAKAVGPYERALAIGPRNPDVRTDLGIMYRQLHDYDRAAKEFREAARIDPRHGNSRFNLGIVLQEDKKDYKGAAAAWKDFLRVEPTGEKAAMAKAELDRLEATAKDGASGPTAK